MTGREIIMFILENNLENTVIFEDTDIPCFMTLEEAAMKWGVGPYSVETFYKMGKIRGFDAGGKIYIYPNQPRPFRQL